MKDWREYPKGYKEACDKYLRGSESAEKLWIRLSILRNLRIAFRKFDPESGEDPPKGYRELAKFVPEEKLLDTYREFVEDAQKNCAEFESRIIKAVYDGDVTFLKKLLKAMQAPNLPEPEMDAIKAASTAFQMLFVWKGFRTKENWPTKRQVRFLAERILGYSMTDRQWSRVFDLAGLSELKAQH